MRRAAVLLVLLPLVANLAAASMVRDTVKEHESRVPAGAAVDVPVAVPFHLEAPGLFYAKLLVTPWNAVNPGTPNGTVKADHSAGTSGWWIEFYLADGTGAPLAADGNGAPMNPALGTYVDSTPTPTTFLASGTPYVLQAIVHVPREAAMPGGRYETNLALVYREGTFTGDSVGSGGRLEASKAFTERIVVEGDLPPTSGTPPTSPTAGATPPTPSVTPPTAGPTAPNVAGTPTSASLGEPPSEVVASGLRAEASLFEWLVLAIALAALALSGGALAVTAYVLVLVRRELRPARSFTPDEDESHATRAEPTRADRAP